MATFRTTEFARIFSMCAGLAMPLFCEAAMMPEFDKSVEFDKSGPEVRMAHLRGKAVVVLFFQSWCPKCNEWSPRLLKQVQETHGSNRGVVLIAIKTDGGGPTEARDYLKNAGADLDLWCVASDKNAAYYKEVTGANALWTYALVGTDGNVVEQSAAGAFYTSGPDTGKFTLGLKQLLKNCGKPVSVLPADRKYPPSLTKIVHCAEVGCLAKALSMCDSAMRSAKDKDPLESLRKDIAAVAEERITEKMTALKNESADWGSRYEAHKGLALLSEEMKALPIHKDAQALLMQTARDPNLQREKAAETAYLAIKAKMKRASEKDMHRVLKDMETLSKKYDGTKYGKIAAEESVSGKKQ